MGTADRRGPYDPFSTFYPDLGGGRNTRKSPHKIARNELAASINGWIPAANSFGKRPGNTAFTGNGQTGSGVPASAMAAVRFSSDTKNTSLIVQTGGTLRIARQDVTGWATIATDVSPTAKILNAAQLFNPKTIVDCAYLVNGVDVPRRYPNYGNCVNLDTSSVPARADASPIRPAYVSTLLGRLYYACDQGQPSGLYVSDPLQPESFTYGGQAPGAAYLPYIIGGNDGVNGGRITGILPLGRSMLIYKESAIYRFDFIGTQGDVGPFQVTLISANVGCVAPKSLVSFDTFHAFLGVDGAYTCSLEGIGTRPISDNNPDLFEGPNAAIVDRTTAVGVRYGPRYLLFFDNGGI